jgi:glutaredoxin
MNKLTISVLAVTLVVIVGGALFFGKEPQSDNSQPAQAVQIENIEYYWRDGCPYCDSVEEFLQDWEGKDSVAIDKKDVGRDRASANLMLQRAQACDIPSNQLGVPFLVTPDGECYIGDAPIIDYLTNL